ncbi:MAG: L,D-transpeptidase [Syntrophobacteraceae bacterium]|nr:L,D-transpeptidase [Syntrophobacteraceae bacterium]
MWRRGKILRGMGLSILCVGLLCSTLCSCSIFQSTCPPPAVKMVQPPPLPLPAPKENVPYATVDFNVPLSHITSPVIYVYKAKHRLLLIEGKTLVREYPCALGPHPKGTKYFHGDGRTPEGKFAICKKNPYSSYHKSLGLSYPSIREAHDALSRGLISPAQYRAIKDADTSQRMPPSDTALGGMVFIHGGGCKPDWTLGCIAVDNADIDELFHVVQIGTPVYIMP